MIRLVLVASVLMLLIGACRSPESAINRQPTASSAPRPVAAPTSIVSITPPVIATAVIVAPVGAHQSVAVQTPGSDPSSRVDQLPLTTATTDESTIPPVIVASTGVPTPNESSSPVEPDQVPPTATPASQSGARGIVLDPTDSRPGIVRTIAIDPGHGGPEAGSVIGDLVEKDLNLRISLYLAELLNDEGFRVVLTRDEDRAVSPTYTQSGVFGQVALDLQARVDIANSANADLFLSVHNNGSGDPNQRGMEVYFNRARPFSDRNIALAEIVLDKTLAQMRQAGYNAFNRGIKDDANFRIFRDRVFNIYVLGPGTGARPHEPTHMPGVLSESLILSNPSDAAALRNPEIRRAIARGHRDAVVAYFDEFPE